MKRKVTGGVVVLMVAMAMRAWGWGRWYDLRLRVKVVDDDGRAVEGAKVETVFDQGGGGWTGRPDRYARFEGLTGSNGEFGARARTLGHVRIGVSKEGYYGWRRKIYFFREGARGDGEWGPYDPWVHGVTAILKRVERPVGMYEKKVGWLRVPVVGEPVGYDLEVGDWVEPYGRGKVGDFVMEVGVDLGSDPYWDYEMGLKLTFSHAGDGIQRGEEEYASLQEGSEFVGLKYAPEGGYEGELELTKGYRGDRRVGNWMLGDQHIWYFRVRTELDETGGVKRALYGKLRGMVELSWDRKVLTNFYVRFHYWLNPNWNDRGLECGWNLFKEGGRRR